MQRLEVSAAVRRIYMSLGFKRLKSGVDFFLHHTLVKRQPQGFCDDV